MIWIWILATFINSLFIGEAEAVETDYTVADMQNEYESGCDCFNCYHAECFEEALIEFDSYFDNLEYIRTANGYEILRRYGDSKFIYCRKIK